MLIRDKLLQHKYKIISLIFLGYMIFFDKNSLIDQYKLKDEYNKVWEEKQYYVTQIEQAKKERDLLFTNDQALEKFAREKYHMKKDDEEVFIMVKEPKQK